MKILKDIKDLVAPTGPRPTPTKYYILADGYPAAQFIIDDDTFYSIYIGLHHWENKSNLPAGAKIRSREDAFQAASTLDDSLREKLLNAITIGDSPSNNAEYSHNAGYFVKIKGAVKSEPYHDEEEFLEHKRELLLQGYKVEDKVTYYLHANEALQTDSHKCPSDKNWSHSCEYKQREEAKAILLEKAVQDIIHDDNSTAPEDRF